MASHRDKPVLSQELCAAWRIEDINLCLAEAERITQRWEYKYPRLAAQIREQFAQTLGVHGLEKTSRRRVYTANMRERVIREMKKRTGVIGIFPNDASCDHLVGAHLTEIHEAWQWEKARFVPIDNMLGDWGLQERKQNARGRLPPPRGRWSKG